MPRRSELRLSKREVDRLSVEGRDRVFWDSVLPGFGVRVYPTGRKIYVAQANSPTGVRRVSLGRHGTLTAGDARKRAVAAIAEHSASPWNSMIIRHRAAGRCRTFPALPS